MQALIRRTSRFSTNQATAGSTSEMADDQAANTNKMKNKVPNTCPPGMAPKAIGSVWKIKPGPAPGSRSLAKTIGKMASPARSATSVSASAIKIVAWAIEVCFGMYEP